MTQFTQEPDGAMPLTTDELTGLKLPGIATHGALNPDKVLDWSQGGRLQSEGANRRRNVDALRRINITTRR